MKWLKRLLGGGDEGAPARPAPPAPPARVPEDEAAYEAFRAQLDGPIRRVYGSQQPFHYGAAILFADGGPDPLDSVSSYWNENGPHWHYIGYGLFPAGFELTFRLRARPEDKGTDPASFMGSVAYNAPTWPISMLNMLARRVHRTQRPFRHGDWWQGPPGVLRPHADFEFLVFAQDPELGVVTTTRGEVMYLQAAAVTADSVEAMKREEEAGQVSTELESLRQANPLLVTDATRAWS